MAGELTQIGVGGILTVMILDKVFAFVKTKNGKGRVGSEHCGFTQDRDEIRDLLKAIERNTRPE